MGEYGVKRSFAKLAAMIMALMLLASAWAFAEGTTALIDLGLKGLVSDEGQGMYIKRYY